MATIKRYPNRKLYDTDAKQYITLDGIADLIRQGEDMQVIDHATGEDLTALTLTQIIFEQEKKSGGFLPRAVLTGLVQAGGDRLGSLRSALAAPLDLLRQVDDEIERRIQGLIKRGELAEAEGVRLKDKLLSPARHAEREAKAHSQERDEPAETEQAIPTHDDLTRLAAQLDALTVKVERLSQQTHPADMTTPPTSQQEGA